MTYFDFQYFHHAAIIIFVFFLVINLSKTRSSLYKILYGVSSLLLLVSGFALFSQENISFSPPYPLWIWGKLLIWLSLATVVPILIKRAPKLASKLGLIFLLLVLAAAYLGVYKSQ